MLWVIILHEAEQPNVGLESVYDPEEEHPRDNPVHPIDTVNSDETYQPKKPGTLDKPVRKTRNKNNKNKTNKTQNKTNPNPKETSCRNPTELSLVNRVESWHRVALSCLLPTSNQTRSVTNRIENSTGGIKQEQNLTLHPPRYCRCRPPQPHLIDQEGDGPNPPAAHGTRRLGRQRLRYDPSPPKHTHIWQRIHQQTVERGGGRREEGNPRGRGGRRRRLPPPPGKKTLELGSKRKRG